MEAVCVTRAAAVALFERLGVDTVHTWTIERLEREINRHFEEYFEGTSPPLDGDAAVACGAIRGALGAGGTVRVLPGEVIRAAYQRAVPRERVGRPPRTAPYSAHQAHWKKTPVKMMKKEGVMQSVLRELRLATPEKPLTLYYLVKLLAAEYPDRSVKGLNKNARNLIPTRLREHYNILVESRPVPNPDPAGSFKAAKGYWLKPSAPDDTKVPEG